MSCITSVNAIIPQKVELEYLMRFATMVEQFLIRLKEKFLLDVYKNQKRAIGLRINETVTEWLRLRK